MILRTERLILREWRDADFDAFGVAAIQACRSPRLCAKHLRGALQVNDVSDIDQTIGRHTA